MPPDDLVDGWCVDPKHGSTRPAAPEAKDDGKGGVLVSGTFAFVPDAPGADLLVGVALLNGKPIGVAIESSANEVSVEEVHRYDATRSLGHVTLSGAPATLLDAPAGGTGRRVAPDAGPDRRRVARQRRDGAGDVRRLRQGASHVRARDRLLPGGQALR